MNENYNPQSVILTNTQKGVLATVYNAPTPESAFEAINGTPTLITARNLLERLGLVTVSGNQAMLSQAGQAAVMSNNLADESGQLTDEGAALIEALKNARTDYKVVEGFSLLKSLIAG